MKSPEVRNIAAFLLEKIEKHPQDLVKVTRQHFGVSRQAVHRHLKSLRAQNLITKTGGTRGSYYAVGSGEQTAKNLAETLSQD